MAVTIMLMVQDRNNEELRTQIIEKAQSLGSITYDDILALLPDAERNLALLDDIMDDLLEAGIAILPAREPGAEIPGEPAPIEDDVILPEPDDFDENEGDWLLKNDDLVDDIGYQQALDTDDVVGLYLKEAGRVPLLTADQEVELAMRME